MRTWLRLQAQAFAAALARFAATPFAHGTSVLVLGVAIALPVAAAMLLGALGSAVAHLGADPHVNVFLALDATDVDVKRIEAALRSHPHAASVRFIPRDEALAELRRSTHLAEILATLDRNPLPHAFTVKVRSAEEGALAEARRAWSALPKVDQVAADFEWSRRVGRWVGFGHRFLAAVSVILALAVAFIVGHLIRLQVLTQREEIALSQLIGATAGDVRRPFLYHGALQGFLAGAAALAIAAGLGWALEAELRALTPSYFSDLHIPLPASAMALLVLAGGALLGWLGAWLAVDRELRRFAAAR